jgi:hypothetical protein
MRYCYTPHCWDCACRQVENLREEVEALSDEHNHAEMKRKLQEKILERRRLKDEAERMGLT